MDSPDIVDTYETDGAILQVGRSAQAEPINPINLGDPFQAFTNILMEHSARMEHCMPGIVMSFNRITHVASVMPLLKMKTNTGDSTQRLPIDVHVWRFASGGKIIDLPVKAGDTGWLIGGDFDTGLAQSKNAQYDPEENAGPQTPTTGDIHKFTFGFFLPDNFCSFPDIARFGDDIVIGEYDTEGNIINSGVGGGGGNMFKYNPSTGIIDGGFVMVKRKTISINSKNVGSELGGNKYIYIRIDHGTTTGAIVSNQNWIDNTLSHPGPEGSSSIYSYTYIPLYRMNDTAIHTDYRTMPILGLYE